MGRRQGPALWWQDEEVKSVTVEEMSKIHESLETMPDEGDEANQPVINLFRNLSEKRVLFISTCM